MAKRTIRLTESKLMAIVKEGVKRMLMVEGAGAGYDIELYPVIIDASTAKINTIVPVDESESYVFWKAKLSPSTLESWRASAYYNGVSSEQGYFSDMSIGGGEIYGMFPISNSEKEKAMEYLKESIDYETNIKISTHYGGGWVHVDLGNPIVLGVSPQEAIERLRKNYWNWRELAAIGDYEDNLIYRVVIDAPDFSMSINEYFENPESFDETDYDYEEE